MNSTSIITGYATQYGEGALELLFDLTAFNTDGLEVHHSVFMN